MKNRTASILNISIGVLLGVLIAGQFAFRDSDKKNSEPAIIYYAPEHPESLSFAGEAVPLDRWDVRERFDREYLFNYYNQANVLFLLKLSNRYFPIISERLKQAGVPDDFKYLCVAESNLIGGARSPVGATGFWQFMSGTAPGYGLEANSNVDYRYDVERSTDAACAYLKMAYQKFGSWTAAAASYNMGQGGYNGQAGFQGTKNYYDLLLPEETNRYIFRILVFKHILENAEALGFQLKKGDAYEPITYRTITVSKTIPNLAQFALAHGTTYKMLRQMNPWIRNRSLPVKTGKTYEIKLPADQ